MLLVVLVQETPVGQNVVPQHIEKYWKGLSGAGSIGTPFVSKVEFFLMDSVFLFSAQKSNAVSLGLNIGSKAHNIANSSRKRGSKL